MMKVRRSGTAVLALVGSLVLAACGDAANSSTTMVVDTTVDTTAESGVDETDVEFAQGMIPHHEQAIEMAEIALDPAVLASADVVALATAIQAAQDPEIALMKGWLAEWGRPEMADMEGHDMSSMEGMMSADDMDALAMLTGAEFDAMWLEMMIAHHEGAVSMAETVKAEGSDPEVSALADAVIAAQTAEIETMTALLAG